MGIFEFAAKEEEQLAHIYSALAENTEIPNLRIIFDELSRQEQSHAHTFRDFAKKTPSMEDGEPKTLEKMKGLLENIKLDAKAIKTAQCDLTLYKSIRNLEKKHMLEYFKLAEETNSKEKREFLLKLAKEEEKHFITMDNIVEFISRPLTWIENAEWTTSSAY